MVKKLYAAIYTLLIPIALIAQPGVVLVGTNHPFHPGDNITLPHLADSLNSKCIYLDTVCKVSSGKEILHVLEEITLQCGSIGNLVLYGHSGYEGFFVKQNSGFHRDNYFYIKKNRKDPLTKNAALVSDLKRMVLNKQIIFDNKAIIILAGCNTAYGEDNIAIELADALNLPVAGPDQKVDLYNVRNKGEELKGLKSRTFFIYFPMPEEIIKYDLGMTSTSITEIFEIAFAKRALLNNNTNYTLCIE